VQGWRWARPGGRCWPGGAGTGVARQQEGRLQQQLLAAVLFGRQGTGGRATVAAAGQGAGRRSAGA
jgi:hypothetical protein